MCVSCCYEIDLQEVWSSNYSVKLVYVKCTVAMLHV